VSLRAINRSTSGFPHALVFCCCCCMNESELALSFTLPHLLPSYKVGLLYVLTMYRLYPAESWAPRVSAHGCKNVYSSFQWANAMARRPSSVRPYVNFCANRFSQANGWIATKLAHDGPQKSLHPGCAQIQGRYERSRDISTFGISQKNR